MLEITIDNLNISLSAFVIVLKEYDADNIGTGGKMLSQVMAERQK